MQGANWDDLRFVLAVGRTQSYAGARGNCGSTRVRSRAA